MLSRQITFNPKEVAVCVLLLLAASAVFGQTILHEFVNLDDGSYVYENPVVSKGLTVSGIVWAFSHGHQSLWVPLTWLSLMIDWELYDIHAGGYHLTNVLLHAATAMLLFLALHRMTGRFWPSAIAAALFAGHPLRVESVAWVTERKDVLSGLFFMLTLLAYVNYSRQPFSLARYALVVLLFALGLMAKPMLITLPCVLLLLDYWPLGRMNAAWQTDAAAPATKTAAWRSTFRNGLRLLFEKIPLFVVAGADCIITILVQAKSLSINEQLSLSWRIGNAMISYVTYLEMFFYPVGLVIVYPRLPSELPLWMVAGSVLILVAITAAVFAARRRCPYLLVGWLWYLGMMTPVIGFLQVGLTAVADRFTYLPQIGIAIALVWGVADLCRTWRHQKWICGAVAAVVLAALMGFAFHLTAQWRDNETLWKYVIHCMPDNVVAHCNLGNALAEEGRLKDAVSHIEDALAVSPTSSIANYNMGYILMVSGRLEPAKEYFTKALAADPNSGGTCDRLGMIYARQGEYDKAIAYFRKALEINPNDPEANYDLAKSLMADGQRDQAKEAFREAARITPDYATSHRKLGAIVAARGRWVEAVEHYERVLDAEPEDVETRLSLADALVQENRPREAAAQLRTVLKFDPNNTVARQKLVALEAVLRMPK